MTGRTGAGRARKKTKSLELARIIGSQPRISSRPAATGRIKGRIHCSSRPCSCRTIKERDCRTGGVHTSLFGRAVAPTGRTGHLVRRTGSASLKLEQRHQRPVLLPLPPLRCAVRPSESDQCAIWLLCVAGFGIRKSPTQLDRVAPLALHQSECGPQRLPFSAGCFLAGPAPTFI
jgi:hypothetical protein